MCVSSGGEEVGFSRKIHQDNQSSNDEVAYEDDRCGVSKLGLSLLKE